MRDAGVSHWWNIYHMKGFILKHQQNKNHMKKKTTNTIQKKRVLEETHKDNSGEQGGYAYTDATKDSVLSGEQPVSLEEC